MISILTNLLFVSATLAAPHLDIKAHVDKLGPLIFSDHLAGALYRDTGTTFTAVSAVLLIPTTFDVSDTLSASAWVGRDGHSCKGIFQTGPGFVTFDGLVSFSTWYRSFDNISYFLDHIDIKAGEAVRLSVTTTTPASGNATIENLTRPQVVSQTFQFSSSLCQRDAEWTVEVPGDFLGFNITPSLLPLRDP